MLLTHAADVRRTAESKALCAKSLELCEASFGPDHPLTLDAKALQVWV